MPNNLQSFGITADDVSRARRFYEQVFQWHFEPWGPPDFYLIRTGTEQDPGVRGLLHGRREPVKGSGMTGFECTIAVDDIDATIQAIEAIKLLLELGDPLVGRLLTYDALDQSFRTFKVRRDPSCPACGENAGPIVIAEYDDLCMPHAMVNV